MSAIYILLFVAFYFYQNKKEKIGGHISAAKTYWLGFAMYVYYLIPAYYIFTTAAENAEFILFKALLNVFLLRFIVQGVMMYISKNWIPRYGILFNGLAIVALMIVGFFLYYRNELSMNIIGWLLFYFYCLILDSYYAHHFFRIVGKKTMGDDALWFASTDASFRRINQLTRIHNFILSAFLAILLYQLKNV